MSYQPRCADAEDAAQPPVGGRKDRSQIMNNGKKTALIIIAAVVALSVLAASVGMLLSGRDDGDLPESPSVSRDDGSASPESESEETSGEGESSAEPAPETTDMTSADGESETPEAETDEPATETEPVTTPAETEPPVTTPAPTEPVPTEPAVTEPATTPAPATTPEPQPEPQPEPDLSVEGGALEEVLEPAQITILRPVASGRLTAANDVAVIDYSNSADGYVMARFTQDPGVRLKVQVIGPTTTYTYNVSPYTWEVFPLSDGNGAYTVKLFKNVVDNRYAVVLTAELQVSLSDEFAPFLRPNQYVNYENATLATSTAASVVPARGAMLDKVKAIYNYVVSNISYDYEKAATVQSGYLPDLDQVLASRKGICFDYAALMTGMLRSQNIPCKLVIGYAGTQYHAWISVWSQETGWIDGAIFFNGINWQNMDPTFASTGSADAINRITYTTKYVY